MLPDSVTALPCWDGPISGEVLSGGLSNEIWKVRDATGDHVVRLGRDYPMHHVDRSREAMTARAAHREGFGPAVEYSAPGVMVTAFVAARTWDEGDLRADPSAVARLIRDFHTRMPSAVSGAAFLFWPFHVIRDYARTLEGSAWDHERAACLALSARMEAAQIPLPLVFGHHDLLPANFLDDGERLWLIDYEYAGFGTPLFDLAGVASNSGMSDDEADALVAAYFGETPDPALAQAFDAMQATSLLREMMWAMVSDLHLAAPGVDYAAYAEENRVRLDAAIARYDNRWSET